MQILAAFAELERNMIVERVRAGVAEAQRQGKHCGRPARIFHRHDAVYLREKGLSFRAIAKQLNLPLTTVVEAVKAYGKSIQERREMRAQT